jgi:hypothetical protein
MTSPLGALGVCQVWGAIARVIARTQRSFVIGSTSPQVDGASGMGSGSSLSDSVQKTRAASSAIVASGEGRALIVYRPAGLSRSITGVTRLFWLTLVGSVNCTHGHVPLAIGYISAVPSLLTCWE